MKKFNLQLFKKISALIIISVLLSCTLENKSNNRDSEKENRKEKIHSSKEVKITEKNNQETVDGEILQISNKSIKDISASFVDVNIKVAYGNFFINDGAKNFVDAEFIYDKYELNPDFSYYENNEKGDLNIKLGRDNDGDINIDTDNDETKCLIELNNKVPMDMQIEFGAGKGKFNINDLLIEELELRFGAGEFDINLGNSSIKELDIEAGVGSVKLDLSGKRKHDLSAEILGGIGELDVKLPSNIGVRAEVRGILGDIDAHGFKKKDRIYTNDAYGKSDVTIDLEIRAGLGDLNLILVD